MSTTEVAVIDTTPLRPTALAEAADGTVALASPRTEGVSQHVERVYRSSECRTPIIVVEEDGDALPSVIILAKQRGATVWSISMDSAKNEQNAVDYLDVGVKNGDWVYLTALEQATPDVLRQIGLFLMTLKPDPKNFPRRELFRLWLCVARPFDINNSINPLLPLTLRQNALLARAGHLSSSPQKMVKHLPEEPPLFEKEIAKHEQRKHQGRESDSESDAEEPEKKLTGMWFHRAVDFFSADAGSTVTRAAEMIFPAVEMQDAKTIEQICASGAINVDKIIQNGMNPLMTAVSREKPESVKALLKSGADPHVKRAADACPLLFMCIESELIFTALLEAGADIHERYQGHKLENHPDTPPHIIALVRQAKGL